MLSITAYSCNTHKYMWQDNCSVICTERRHCIENEWKVFGGMKLQVKAVSLLLALIFNLHYFSPVQCEREANSCIFSTPFYLTMRFLHLLSYISFSCQFSFHTFAKSRLLFHLLSYHSCCHVQIKSLRLLRGYFNKANYKKNTIQSLGAY